MIFSAAASSNKGLPFFIPVIFLFILVSSLGIKTSYAQSCTPAPSDIVSWWSAEGDATDRISGNNGNIGGNTSFGAGEVDQGFVFDGTNSFIDLGNPGNLQLQDFTIEAWIKRTSSSVSSTVSPYGIILSYGRGGYGLGLWNDGRLLLTTAFINNVDIHIGLTDNTNFHHIAITKSGNTVVGYLDGVAFPAVQYDTTFTFETSISIGAGGDMQDSSFYGSIDELAVYSRALSTAEIQAIYNAGRAGKCLSGAPIITVQPTDATVRTTKNVTFNVAASGDLPLAYEWFFNGTNIPGATNFSLTLTNVQLDQAGPYMVVVSNPTDSALSTNAILTVLPAPPCDTAPSNIVNWWPAEGNTLDNLGGVNGTLTNGMSFAPAEVGQGFLCNGINSAVQLGNPLDLQLQNFTIEAWVQRSSATASSLVAPNAALISYGTGGYGFGVWNDGRLFLTKANFDNLAVGVGFTDTNSFHHVAVTKSNTQVTFYFDGVAFPPVTYNSTFTFTTPIAIGAEGDNYNTGFYGVIDEMTVYNRKLSSNEIQNIFNAGVTGKCPLVTPPAISVQPASQTSILGATVTFVVAASGPPPVTYQWNLNLTPIPGATNSSLTVTNLQPTAGDTYAVLVSNNFGHVLSSNATLVVSPQFLAGSVIVNGGAVTVPINLVAEGDEDSAQFSVSFNSNLLSYAGIALGTNVASGFITANTNQLPNGRLGLFLLLPTDGSFSPGTQQVARISFNAISVTNTITTAIAFVDQPTPRQLSDTDGVPIPATYVNGNVTIPFLGYEGDLAPRTNGDNSFSLADWQQVGKFVAGLDSATNGNEFQRADCAPRATFGDGLLTVADWVQTLRYVTGADPMTQGGGPAQSIGTNSPNPSAIRILTAVSSSVQAGQSCQVSVRLNAQGNEDALGFSIAFNPAALSFTSATIGSGAGGATFLANTNRATNGAVGIALELPFLSTLASGTQEVAKLNFNVLPFASHSTLISFTNQPVLQDAADANAVSLPVGYQSGTLSISNSVLNLSAVTKTNGKLVLSWSAALTNFNLESNTNLASTNWTIVSSGLVTNAGTISVTNSTSGSHTFYRLHHP